MTKNLPTLDYDNKETLELMKNTICRGSTDGEFELFAYTCKRLGLDPFSRQIFSVKRWDSGLKKEVMTIQTSIDGYRLIADRTGRYSPGKDPDYVYDNNGSVVCAKSYVMKQTPDGTWHEVCASAHYSEYAGLKKDGTPTMMWKSKPHVMLSKCAEALALRKAFPAELSGAYTKEEMEQADNPVVIEPIQTKLSPSDYHSFIDKWCKKYDKNMILDYIEKRSSHFGKTANETVSQMIGDEEGFVKEFESWIAQEKKKQIDINVDKKD